MNAFLSRFLHISKPPIKPSMICMFGKCQRKDILEQRKLLAAIYHTGLLGTEEVMFTVCSVNEEARYKK